MALKSQSLLFVLVVLVVLLLSSHVEGKNNFNTNLAMASKTLSDKGFHAMSMILNVFFNTVNTPSGNLTVFCPPDAAFFTSKYPQPPLTLLQYHVVPLKLESQDLGFLHHGSKIDTLLLGHPLVVTSLPSNEYATLNEVRITEWNLYNDGGLTIHGIDSFFDPAFQTLKYPRFDHDHDVKKEAEVGIFSRVMEALKDNWVF